MKLTKQSDVYVFSLQDEFVSLNTFLFPYYEILPRKRQESLSFYTQEATILMEQAFARERMLRYPRCTDEDLQQFDAICIKHTSYRILQETAMNSGFCLQPEDVVPW